MEIDATTDSSPDRGPHIRASAPALQACSSCRKQKRKCDKQLPTCSLCLRIGRICDYSVENQTPALSVDEFAALRQKVADLESRLSRSNGSTSSVNSNGSNGTWAHIDGASSDNSPANVLSPPPAQPSLTFSSSFSPLYFLDSNLFEYGRYQIQAPYVRVPPGALTALGSSTQLREMIEQYFATVQTYFPIISKIRLYQHLANPSHEPGADIALLFLAMKLIGSEVPEGMPAQTQLYLDVKSFYHFAESQNAFSIQTIQALLLLCLYELGHCIYPAAFLSIGNAARLGICVGLHERGAPQMLPRCSTWTEQEERRRVWWGVIILDRFVNIGHRNKPFASPDPSLDTHLPTDDSYWDRGQMLVAAPLALSASETTKAAPFARICQASHLLGKVVRHINDTNLPVDFRYNEALQINRTTLALSNLLPGEAEKDDPAVRSTLCGSMAICYSALLTLYDSYSCTERAPENPPETQLYMQKESIEGLSEVSAQVMILARRVRSFIERAGMGKLNPLIIDSFYQAAANYAWYVRESSDRECAERLAELKELLVVLDRRWRIAGEYLKIVEATEFQMASAVG